MNRLARNRNNKSNFLGDVKSDNHILDKYRLHTKSRDKEIKSNMTPEEVADVISDRLISIIENDEKAQQKRVQTK